MKRIKYSLAVALFSAFSLSGVAQTAKSAYFLDGTFSNYLLNPAMDAERAYFSILGGNFSLATNSNVGLSDFIYPYGDDKLTTFMSGTVSQNEFLKRLPKSIRLATDVDMTLLAFGRRMFGGYTNVSLTLNSNFSTRLPKGLFEFAKMGLQKDTYSFSDLRVSTMNYAALTIGHSREVMEGLRVGVNAKVLYGIAYADVHVEKLNISLKEDQWMVESHAQAEGALFAEAQLTNGEDGVIEGVESPVMDDVSSAKPSARGFAFDLGATYDMDELVEGLTLSASLIDLGYIKWRHMMKASTRDNKFVFDGFTELNGSDFEGSVNDEFGDLGEDAMDLVDLYSDGVVAQSTGLGATMYLGAEYSMPFYNPLSAALLYGKRFGKFGWNDLRAYVNVAPVKWFEASINAGVSTYGTSLGWMLNMHPVGLNIFFGSDYMITKVTPQFIPVNNLNGHFTFGINFPVGARK